MFVTYPLNLNTFSHTGFFFSLSMHTYFCILYLIFVGNHFWLLKLRNVLCWQKPGRVWRRLSCVCVCVDAVHVAVRESSVDVVQGDSVTLPCSFFTMSPLIHLSIIWTLTPFSDQDNPTQVSHSEHYMWLFIIQIKITFP